MKQLSFWLTVVAWAIAPLAAAESSAVVAPNPVYVQRADKIVATLSVADSAKAGRVRDAIAEHYRNVNVIADDVEARVKEIKKDSAADKAGREKALRDEAQAKLDKIHAAFLEKLSADLTPAQVDQVKDGLTYGILGVTWNAYQKMYPNLKAEEKEQIMAWLKEAREHAMDAGSSEAKHAWFGKFKGRINNYLSKAGYNAKEAEKNLTQKP